MFRGPGAIIVWWVWLVVAAVSLVDLAVQGRDHTAALAAALLVAVTGVLYATAHRPRIVADADGITVTNPLREYRVPWDAVDSVDVRGSLRVHCAAMEGAAEGKVIHSWAVQASPRAAMRRERTDRRESVRLAQRSRRTGLPVTERAAAPGNEPDRVSAEYIARQLTERLRNARSPDAATAGTPGTPGERWMWAALGAVVLPVLLLIVVALV